MFPRKQPFSSLLGVTRELDFRGVREREGRQEKRPVVFLLGGETEEENLRRRRRNFDGEIATLLNLISAGVSST